MTKVAKGLMILALVFPMAAGWVSLPGASQPSWDGTGLWGVQNTAGVPEDLWR